MRRVLKAGQEDLRIPYVVTQRGFRLKPPAAWQTFCIIAHRARSGWSEVSRSEIAEVQGILPSTVSTYIRALTEAELIRSDRRGRLKTRYQLVAWYDETGKVVWNWDLPNDVVIGKSQCRPVVVPNISSRDREIRKKKTTTTRSTLGNPNIKLDERVLEVVGREFFETNDPDTPPEDKMAEVFQGLQEECALSEKDVVDVFLWPSRPLCRALLLLPHECEQT